MDKFVRIRDCVILYLCTLLVSSYGGVVIMEVVIIALLVVVNYLAVHFR